MSDQTLSEAPGATQDTAVVVSRLVSHPIKDVWKVLLTDEGTEALLGPGGRLGDKGQGWQADDGTHGVTRSFHPLEQIRFSWHRDENAPATLVDLHLSAEGEDRTKLEIVHDKLPADADRDWLTEHWTKALDRISEDAL
ncbi:SRPBCC domain-containing protein [Luteococcus peritonei]|uniref:SRPBCC domain-containing protein n=1 Tax=Luteococcus peritonei TaxID=88874 RepID=A0ABW4RQW6_9ACTN